MKAKRRRYSGAFKARVGLEALLGVKTVGQIAKALLTGEDEFGTPPSHAFVSGGDAG